MTALAICQDCARRASCEHEPEPSGECGARIQEAAPLSPDELAAQAKRRELWASVRIFSAREEQEAELPPRTWFIDGLVTTGLTILSARKGLGKSFFALQAAAAIAAGGTFLGKRTKRTSTLYVPLELDRIAIHERTAKMPPLPDGLNIAYAWPRGDEALSLLEAAIIEGGYRVLFIDMISGILPDGAETNSYDLSPWLLRLRHVALDNGAAIVALHHSIKGNSGDHVSNLMGSTAFGGQADSILVIERKRGEPGAKVHVSGNHGHEQVIGARFDSCRWILSDDDAGRDEKPEAQPADIEVLRLIRESPAGLTTSDIATATGKTVGAARTAVRRLADRGLVVEGKGSARSKRWIPSPGPGLFGDSPADDPDPDPF